MSISKEVWLGSNNKFTLQLMEEDSSGVQEAVPTGAISKMELYLTSSSTPTISVVSLVSDSVRHIDWLAQDGPGYVTFKLGNVLKSINAKPIAYSCELQVYDAGNPDGVVWFSTSAKDFVLRVRAERTV
jgi:hypothetical protein